MRDYVDQGAGVEDRLERLWAPYRMNYIRNESPSTTGEKGVRANPFITIPSLSDEDGLIVARGQHVYAVLNLYPYNSGHMMVVPYRQVAELENLTLTESTELMLFAQTAIKVLKKVSQPDAINAGFNLGRSSGGSVGEHLHMHIVPRWNGDASFMTIISGTKVLPQLLRDTRSLLAQGWIDLEGAPGVAHA
ncbi:Hit (histidine triad) family protein [Corynebacterium kutscheri]|uniref:HIT family hydrolase, diadenosine tetraphosphate hydrolase n=1 Tax=Corynebacterium kutscheri TaxID=35755 RepID=A0A0F6R0M2_9CORY|nr:HIT domain-containing protein [Corynebacterium kutscheri]AKE41355.1 HIT family hydrolase, diadenosine tetraphosphate hydrolase [Corynebacterium kutscheri]VEH08631.1 Hit (histidine triad) family protein [Corynebacterium kutscheri]VEH09677.1 Hit (histidine triad) family protein [Corynebacterium kutscheri]VEH79760.1 Hit (histidine triad) family protein [Corynebacterium kutscheri]